MAESRYDRNKFVLDRVHGALTDAIVAEPSIPRALSPYETQFECPDARDREFNDLDGPRQQCTDTGSTD